MPFFAAYDGTLPDPAPVTGWYDTTALHYPTLPNTLLPLTLDQWTARLTGLWAVSSRVLMPYTPPTPTLTFEQQAAQAVAAGLLVSLSGSMTLPPTLFPTDADTQRKLGGVIAVINTSGMFPGGAATFPIKDSDGDWVAFTIDQYKAVAGAIATYVAALDLIIDGNPLNVSALPSPHIMLTV